MIQRKNLIEDYEKKIENAKQDIKDTEKSLSKASNSRGNNDGQRDKLLVELAKLQKEKASLDSEVKNYERSDPKIVQKMEDDSKVAKDAANRWTDNLYLIM